MIAFGHSAKLRRTRSNIGHVRAGADCIFGQATPTVINFDGVILLQRRPAEGIDKVIATIDGVPIELMHYRGADETGVHSAFDKVAGCSQTGLCGPQCDMHAPLETRVDAVARFQAATIGCPESTCLAKVVVVNGDESILRIAPMGPDNLETHLCQSFSQ
jgi:hypothetical protein